MAEIIGDALDRHTSHCPRDRGEVAQVLDPDRIAFVGARSRFTLSLRSRLHFTPRATPDAGARSLVCVLDFMSTEHSEELVTDLELVMLDVLTKCVGVLAVERHQSRKGVGLGAAIIDAGELLTEMHVADATRQHFGDIGAGVREQAKNRQELRSELTYRSEVGLS